MKIIYINLGLIKTMERNDENAFEGNQVLVVSVVAIDTSWASTAAEEVTFKDPGLEQR